jgi:integrase
MSQKQRREQKGHIFRRGKSWFVRFCDDLMQSDGTVKRKLVCKKLEVCYSDEFRTVKSVRPFAAKFLVPINQGLVTLQSTMRIGDFIEKEHLLKIEEHRRASTLKGYRDVWRLHLKGRIGTKTLREFRTVDGERLLADIARQDLDLRTKKPLSKNSLARIKSFLSGVFKQAKRLGILDGVNPMMDVSTPEGTQRRDTFAYSLADVKAIRDAIPEPARTVVLVAALSGLRKGEIAGLRWEDYTGRELSVRRSVWNGTVNEPKTKASGAAVPVMRQLADALDAHKLRVGILAQPGLPIFQGGTGQPMNLDNLARRVIQPAIEKCGLCKLPKDEHKTDGHLFEQNKALPKWHGWHAFRRGLATNLHALGTADKEIQAILRHSNISVTQSCYIKALTESQVSAMKLVGEEFENGGTCTNLATDSKETVN